MRRALVLAALAGCPHTPAQPAPPPPSIAQPPPTTPQARDACADDAARLQPMLDANVALFQKWGDKLDVDPDPLVPATGELEPVTDRVPIVVVAPHKISLLGRTGPARAIASRVRSLVGKDAMASAAVALAIARDTPWSEVVDLVHALTGEGLGRVKVVFAVDRSAVRVPNNPIVAQLHGRGDPIEIAQNIGRDLGEKCPAIAELFAGRNPDQLQIIARDAAKALQSCQCAAPAAMVANIYDALLVGPYVAVRTIALSSTGAAVAASATATFADAAHGIVALSPNAAASFEVSRS